MSDKPESPFGLAMQDAILYGAGWILIRPSGEVVYVAPEKYLQVADELRWAHDQINKSLPNK